MLDVIPEYEIHSLQCLQGISASRVSSTVPSTITESANANRIELTSKMVFSTRKTVMPFVKTNTWEGALG